VSIDSARIKAVATLVASGTTVGRNNEKLEWNTFTWGHRQEGDCTRHAGATWTLYSDGWADWDATVTSGSDNDAWLMWARTQDANRAEFGLLSNANVQNPADPNEFIQNIPVADRHYRWLATGRFDANRFHLIQWIVLNNHC
jgi:hypothetical protein